MDVHSYGGCDIRGGRQSTRETKQRAQKGRGSWQGLLEKQSEQKEKKKEDSEEF